MLDPGQSIVKAADLHNNVPAGSPYVELLKTHVIDYETTYEILYKHVHANPELSHLESGTASLIAEHLRLLSSRLDIRTNIGGHGIVAILLNGSGPTIMLRADIDALPVSEKTSLPYASKHANVMHACGHDMHLTALLAAGEILIRAAAAWSGTLIMLFQPAEEAGDGAKGMIADGLYDPRKHACPIPDIVLGQHVAPLPAGTLTVAPGVVMCSSDNFQITIHGHGGHGSMPHACIDPLVIASHIVVRLQTIVAREIPPDQTVVITVGSLHAGHAENVISDEAVLKVNIRAVSAEWRARAIESVQRVVRAECEAGRCTRPPDIEAMSSLPATDNDATTTASVEAAFGAYFGPRLLKNLPRALGSEDVSELATAVHRPYCFWFWGGVTPEKLEEKPLVVNHSPFFAPLIQPTLRTGAEALAVAALTFLAPAKA
ncbi:uncharacterized protein HMPREF1541_03812 [Cyphellophora europaea CBS 101466]|uniref:Peptidase M20 dimerisation domain-containing protein n=1 Tax=Cyphellophora europaea (strain CBS 101466) TaxID=1220924 RepID=W2S1G4_CYPE1|nr:uncharacterized protein HMPREF1541_03812 [Cyphellophora europaea CBS 101466]ETN41873.1 hypothetical protein HMPREF1541_03812 [Cyphellophora europaea CBS 101466]